MFIDFSNQLQNIAPIPSIFDFTPMSNELSKNKNNEIKMEENKFNQKKKEKVFNIERNSYIKDKSSNFNSLTKQSITMPKKNIKLLDILPNLNQIKLKFTKRENIDKKIIKFFKNFVKGKIKNEKKKTEEIRNISFWKRFIQGMYTPPFYYVDESTNETIEFKSTNSLYIIWIFQNEFANELYSQFLQENGNDLFNKFLEFFEVNEKEDKKVLKYYMFNFNKIFSLEQSKNIYFK